MSKKLPIVAIVGQTNAGKSALFNRIVGRQEAIVAREAGTTRDSVVRTVTTPVIARNEMTKQSRNGSGSRRYARDDDTSFVLVDTAGLKNPEDEFEATIQDQIDDAIDSADLILLVKDITEPATQSDRDMAKKALRSKKPVILVLNKTDLKEKLPREEFLRLGIKDIFETSAEHNKGIKNLVASIVSILEAGSRKQEAGREDDASRAREQKLDSPIKSANDPPPSGLLRRSAPRNDDGGETSDLRLAPCASELLKVALIGRPNVGKSHLFNTLAGKQQAIVAPVAGTTRDINRINVKYHNRDIELLDTAGVRRKGKIEVGVEKFSILRTTAAIEESDVCLLLMDVNELNTSVDQGLAGMITEVGKGIIIVVTKWDDEQIVDSRQKTVEGVIASEAKQSSVADDDPGLLRHSVPRNDHREDADEILRSISSTFDFIPYAPVILTSSVTGKNVTKIYDLVLEIAQRRQTVIPTRKLNQVLQKAVAAHPPAGLKNTYPKLRYMVQTDVNPPWFVIYGANLKLIHWSYKRYLERQLRESFDLAGTPIKFSFRNKDYQKDPVK